MPVISISVYLKEEENDVYKEHKKELNKVAKEALKKELDKIRR